MNEHEGTAPAIADIVHRGIAQPIAGSLDAHEPYQSFDVGFTTGERRRVYVTTSGSAGDLLDDAAATILAKAPGALREVVARDGVLEHESVVVLSSSDVGVG